VTEAFICDAIRTPFGRYGGALRSVRTDDLAAIPIAALIARNGAVDWSAVDEVFLGCANQAGEDNRNVARMASLLAGLPIDVPALTVNRLCGSGLDAVALAARAIEAGEADLIVAGGVESMTRAPYVVGKSEAPFSRGLEMHDSTLGWRFINPILEERYGVDSMAETAENVAAEHNVSRSDQDAFAVRSQAHAAAAMQSGRFAREIVAVPVPQKKGDPVVVATDEQPRPDTTQEVLAKLKPIVRPGGTVTAGNSSGVNDGAGALLIASAQAIQRHKLTPLTRIVATASAGVAPRVMGIGPVPASRKALARAGLSLAQMDVVELNEAFAAQSLAVLRELGLPDDAAHVNPNGGAIALGHPLGASGARLAATATYQLLQTGGRYALCTMCVGVGQGVAMILERVAARE
jgi:3-oxoadipyl-CoA thiolase